MKPRHMRIDFKGAPIQWAASRDFATIINSNSPLATAFEGYLNSVMGRVRDALPVAMKDVRREIDLFVAQEGHHYRVHAAFNRELFAVYPKLKQFEAELLGSHKKQFDTWSIELNMAYCAAFENLACYMAKFTFAKCLPLYEGSDKRLRTLVLWHNAEEFEHRAACSNALKAISGNYFLRMRGFMRFMRQLNFHHKRILSYMFEVDRADMTPEQRAESIRFETRYKRAFAAYVYPRMLQIFLPFYDPQKQKAPAPLYTVLEEYEQLTARSEVVTG